AIAGLAVEAIGWSVRVSTRRPEVERVARLEAAREVAIQRTRPIHDAGTDSVVEAAVVEREALSPGDRVGGPAVIVEPQTTTWVSSNRQAVVQADGCLLITRSDAEGSSR
ncbi:MAG: hydantoinase/oxoprolinase family protein, partial [Acidimicrobiales bacterium]